MTAVKKFNPNLDELSVKERRVFDKLVLAAELMAPLYLKQKNSKYPGANFYPHDAVKKEIEQAARKNPKIFAPYTFIERDKSGKLITIPFHLKFKKELKKISEILKEAALLSDDKNFKKYLQLRAESLLSDNYDKATIQWLKTEHSKFGFVIGPIERYSDKLFHLKCTYKSCLGILDERKTEEIKKFKEMILVSKRKILFGSVKVDPLNLKVRVEKTAIFSGWAADLWPTGATLPNEDYLIKKYGSMLTIFEDSLKEKFKEKHYPIFKTIFNQNFQKRYSEKELYEASFRCLLIHEIAHSLLYYQEGEKKLQELYPFLNEICASILGIERCQILSLKNILTEKELETILIMHICRNFTWWFDFLKTPETSSHAIGAILMQNFFLKEKAIEIDKSGFLKIDFLKAYFCINEFCRLLEYYLSVGTYNEAADFIKTYGQPRVFQKNFSSVLKRFKK